ncbi:hypothetical protein AB7M63_001144 [Bradyrhizobium japonicum]
MTGRLQRSAGRWLRGLVEKFRRRKPRPVDGQVENIEPALVADDIVELLRLDAFVEVDVCVGGAFFVLQRVAENVTGRIDEKARRALLTVPQVMVMLLLLEHGQAASLVTADGHRWLALAYTVFIGRSAWGEKCGSAASIWKTVPVRRRAGCRA